MISIRESFGAKLLSALLGTVGLLLIVTYVVVRTVTTQQVEGVAARTTENAGTLFEERNAMEQQVVERLARPFTDGRRALAALRASLRSRDFDALAGVVDFETDLQGFRESLLVFTDDEGVPVLSVINGERFDGADPAGMQPLAEQLLFGDALEARGYRVYDGVLYNVWSIYLELGGRPLGVAAFGAPIEDADIQPIGLVGGFEACLAFAGRCVVSTALVSSSPELGSAMLASIGAVDAMRITVDGSEWSIRSEPLVEGRPGEGERVVAVPLDPVLAPFESIQRALIFGGLGALILSVLLGTMLGRSLTRPVKELVAATGRVAEGDYEAQVTISSKDELGTLGHAFNDMTRGLLVREQYRSVLSKVVSPDIAEELMKGEVELGGENREMSVLFADIRGFTPLTEGMEPQEVIGLLNECMERLSGVVDLEGGVVDKFIGDEVMAVFGAPVTQPDHALRAVSAAVRMRAGIDAMNEERTARGERPIGVGIGVASGVAVAGNMGSTDRMNYTVLGATVNLAARLTSAAMAGEILISCETRSAAGDACVASSLGDRSLKGFSSEVEVWAVKEIDKSVTRRAKTAIGLPAIGEQSKSMISMCATLGVGLISAALASPVGVAAQWPTLADAGLGYISSDGGLQLDLSGQIDLEGFYFGNDTDGLSGLAVGSDGMFAPRVRLFLDTFLGDHVYALVEWRGDRGEAPTSDFWEARVEQAYVRLTNESGSFSVQGGIFANPFGSYSGRHLSVIDPFIRPPLLYDYRTVISRRWSPSSEDRFLRWRENPEEWRTDGAPPVWGVPYQWGAMSTLSAGIFQFRVAAMNNAPSSEPLDWYEFEVIEEEVSWVAGVQAKLSPELTLGWSYNTGPYVGSDVPNRSDIRPACCPGYDQTMWSLDAAFARGPVMLRAEFVHDSWEIPNLTEEAVDLGFTAEAQLDVTARVSTALRYGRIDFREFAQLDDWDWDVRRWEAAIGYRITFNAGIMATYATTGDASNLLDPDDNLAGIRLWWGF